MERDNLINSRLAKYILDSGEETCVMATVSRPRKMAQNMLENGKTTVNMEKEPFTILAEIFMKVTGAMTRPMVKECISR